MTYTDTRAKDTQEKYKKELESVFEKINDVRMENTTYSIDLIKKTGEVEIDYQKLNTIKSEITSTLDHKILHMVQMHQTTYSEFDILRTEHEKIRMRFNELSDFLKNSKNPGQSGINSKDAKKLGSKISFSGKKNSEKNLNSNNDSFNEDNNINLNLTRRGESRKSLKDLSNNNNNNVNFNNSQNSGNGNTNLEDIENPSSQF